MRRYRRAADCSPRQLRGNVTFGSCAHWSLQLRLRWGRNCRWECLKNRTCRFGHTATRPRRPLLTAGHFPNSGSSLTSKIAKISRAHRKRRPLLINGCFNAPSRECSLFVLARLKAGSRLCQGQDPDRCGLASRGRGRAGLKRAAGWGRPAITLSCSAEEARPSAPAQAAMHRVRFARKCDPWSASAMSLAVQRLPILRLSPTPTAASGPAPRRVL